MPTFEYQALREDGSAIRGTVLGGSLESATADLVARGLRVTSIAVAGFPGDPLAGFERPRSEAAPGIPAPRESAFTPPPTDPRTWVETDLLGPVAKASLSSLAFFFRQLSTMLQAGVPFVQSLDTLSRQTTDPRLKPIVAELREHVKAGRPMSVGMQRYPEVFSPLMLSLIRTGEKSGNLDGLLGQTADYLDTEIELRNLYRRVTIYPKILIFASIIIILGANAIISAVAPGGKGLASPLTTASTWFWLGPLLVGLFVFFRWGLANPRIRSGWEGALLYIPFLGGTLHRMAMAKFGRSFGALHRAGLPMAESFQLAADACGNEALRAKMYTVVRQLEQGAPLTETLRGTQAFSPIVLDMVHTGETTGNLDKMLDKTADYYEDDAKTRSIQLGYITGVAVLLLVAAYIGYIVVSFWSGYFSGIMSGAQ